MEGSESDALGTIAYKNLYVTSQNLDFDISLSRFCETSNLRNNEGPKHTECSESRTFMILRQRIYSILTADKKQQCQIRDNQF